MDDNMLLNLALDAGEIMMTSGAETHRVEDTMERILSVGGNNLPEAVALSTMLIVSIHSPLAGSLTMTRKVPNRSIDFQKICLINSLSRKFVTGKMTLEEAYQELATIYRQPFFPSLLTRACYGIASGAFTLMFSGDYADGLVALLAGTMLGTFMGFLSKKNTPYFLNSLFGGVFAATFALLFYTMGLGTHYDIVIVGSIMPLLPGVTITNAIRDTMEGNMLSGISKIIEAILVAIAVAGGVGFVLSIYPALVI